MSATKLNSSAAKHFPRWDVMLDEHFDCQYNGLDWDEKERERVFFQSNELLMSIAEHFFSLGKFKDSWDNSKCYINVYGQNLLLKSEKLDTIFHWGLDEHYFYLECHIIYAENLRYMNDEFYELILALKALGDFEFFEVGRITKDERPYYENKTSTVFQLIRNFMLYQTEKMNGSNYQQPPSLDLGQFCLKWDAQRIDWEELIEKASAAFKIMYNINYKLWKVSNTPKAKSSIAR
ncbi:hypothetical protein [Pedobacter roseus]|uniref:Uncharacterized protein n=1 Tax=Pedobacter roseus TaxID=336820 RepID=A0A7G9QH13_9SPHI|nr:hypothetical protein [Pedobacter roseus]QNN42638.1 hypothetical protein H9L23_00520 [Pedobacter roseus]